jgi:hypothetical protein
MELAVNDWFFELLAVRVALVLLGKFVPRKARDSRWDNIHTETVSLTDHHCGTIVLWSSACDPWPCYRLTHDL